MTSDRLTPEMVAAVNEIMVIDTRTTVSKVDSKYTPSYTVIDDIAIDTSEVPAEMAAKAPAGITTKEMRLMLHSQLKRESLVNEARLKGLFVDKLFKQLNLTQYR